MRSRPVKALYIVAGSTALTLGAVGIVLPLLPTTPFLLLAAFCYTRSSKRLHSWLLNHRIFGFYIHSYITHKAVDRRTKFFTILILWGTMGLSMLIVQRLYVTFILIAIGLAVTTHLLRLKTLDKEAMLESHRAASISTEQ